MYKDFNIVPLSFRLSLRDPEDTEKYFQDDEMWNKAENKLRSVLKDLKIDYEEAVGEAAFYGPKLDVQIKTAIGHELTLSTCQLDFLLPERFDLTYVDENGEKKRPVVIHRAILGSIDRFLAYLIEVTKGAFPLWLSPKQINIIPVNNAYHLEFCKKLQSDLEKNNFRVTLDDREEKLSYKMRESVINKIPYTLIIGDKELETEFVSYRKRGSNETINIRYTEFIKQLNKEIEDKVIE